MKNTRTGRGAGYLGKKMSLLVGREWHRIAMADETEAVGGAGWTS